MSSALHDLLAIVGRPSYVKSAAEQPYRKEAGYPTNNRESTYLSWCRALNDGAPADKLSKIAEMADFWGIKADIKAAEEKFKLANQTVDPTDDDYALCQVHNGRKIQKFAAFDADSTARAAEAFYEHRTRYPYAWRKEAAVRLIKKANDFGAVVPEYINTYLHKAAGFGYPTQESVENALLARSNVQSAKHDDAITKLAEVLGVIAASPVLRYNEELVKTAMHVLDQFDNTIGCASRYGKSMPMPEELIGMTEPELRKMAAAQNDSVTLTNGVSVKIAELDKDMLGAVDPELAKLSSEELRDVLPTLPRPDADLLVRLSA